jgi:hypothetical protein
MDTRYYRARDRVRQGQYKVVWRPGSTNEADYSTVLHLTKAQPTDIIDKCELTIYNSDR